MQRTLTRQSTRTLRDKAAQRQPGRSGNSLIVARHSDSQAGDNIAIYRHRDVRHKKRARPTRLNRLI